MNHVLGILNFMLICIVMYWAHHVCVVCCKTYIRLQIHLPPCCLAIVTRKLLHNALVHTFCHLLSYQGNFPSNMDLEKVKPCHLYHVIPRIWILRSAFWIRGNGEMSECDLDDEIVITLNIHPWTHALLYENDFLLLCIVLDLFSLLIRIDTLLRLLHHYVIQLQCGALTLFCRRCSTHVILLWYPLSTRYRNHISCLSGWFICILALHM